MQNDFFSLYYIQMVNPKNSTLSRIRHRHLLCFLEIANSKRISTAASAMNISQPAVSKTLSELESILETKLFVRGGRAGIQLTSSGSVFHRYATASIASLQLGLDGVRNVSNTQGSQIKVGALIGVASRLMPEVIQKFCREHDTRVQVISSPETDLLRELRLGRLDLVVGWLGNAKEMSGLTFRYLYSDEMIFVVNSHNSLADSKPFDVSRLERLTLLIPIASGAVRPVIDHFLISKGISTSPNIIEVRSPDFCREYLKISNAVWFISRGVVERDIQSGELNVLEVDTSDTRGPVGITIRSDSEPTPLMRAMMTTITNVVDDHSELLRLADEV